MAIFSSTAAELTRQYKQNKNDIEELYEQGKETSAKVDNLTTKVDDLSTEVSDLRTRVGGLETKVDARFNQVDARFNQVDARFNQVDARFDRLEQLLAPASQELDASSPLDFLPTPQEQSIRLLKSKMNLYSSYTRNNSDELERHKQLFAAHEARFDALDSQMAEVLSILRGKSA